MNRISCDIIKDLLPLYIDGVCSDDSAAAVSAHLENCAACKGYCDGLKTAIIKPEISESEQKEIDIIKKIRNRYIGIALAFVFALSLAMLLWGLNLPGGDEMGYSLIVFYLLFPLICLVLSALTAAKKSAAFLPGLCLVILSQIFIPFFVFHTFEITLPLVLTAIPCAVGAAIGLLIRYIRKK
ncbi:MAG: zf-HC2 domain-containing protein [Clostridia bacterium]|nr:zf-HC2 domain-containing protein [Clostridia bacterium]